ncbi:hypothetical protein Hypma_009241 [Hypsizygus marmoreus]|uniref:Invertebrate defensins family profile domain-containing protein n=1 Tax=Hypsizygus marmoreus TaxID=39966 RepID=A0A369JNY0_HYPMA|nr:hypothetical protein Hypma_009241 [Hypsizygus marmoreus]
MVHASSFLFASVAIILGIAPSLAAPAPLDSRSAIPELLPRAYSIAGCGEWGAQLPAYCNGGTVDHNCKCSGYGVYGCKKKEFTDLCKLKGCGCSK